MLPFPWPGVSQVEPLMKLTTQMDRRKLSGGWVTPGTTLKSGKVNPALSDQKRSGNGNQW